MRVCIIAPPSVPVPPPAYGGTETVLDTLARGLQAAGHDVLLVTTGDSTCAVPKRWCLGTAVGVGLARTDVELEHAAFGYAAAADWGADVVHDHTLAGPLYRTCAGGPPVVTTNHGPFTSPALGPYYRVLSGRVPIIAISRHQAAEATGVAIEAVIHHGIDVERFEVGDGDGGYALFLGRMTPDKGVDAAIRIARAACVRLLIAAKMREADEVAFFRSEIEPMLADGVEYLGEVDAAEKQRLLAGATCLLNPIRWPEPFGMVMVESLAAGTPVLAPPRGSVPEIVDDGVTGFVRAGEGELAAALSDVGRLDRAACRRAVEERFSAARFVAGHVAVYERLASARRVPTHVA